MLSLTRKPGEAFFFSLSAEDLLAIAAQKRGLDFSFTCTRILGNKATFSLDIPACMRVRREDVVLDEPKQRDQYALHAVEVVLDSETEVRRWLTQMDVYPFSVPPSDEPLVFSQPAHAQQHARLIGKFVPEALQAYQVPVLVTIERREESSCVGS